MTLNKDTKCSIPILVWETEGTMRIPILHLLPREASLARWAGQPLFNPRPRRRLVLLNRRPRL